MHGSKPMFNSFLILNLLIIRALIVFVSSFRNLRLIMPRALLDIVYFGIWLHGEYENVPETKEKVHRVTNKIIGKGR
ncbi:hypothetical protein DFO56_10696 [Kosakonia sp. AG348]|nr:hypothetical protein DFO56_10696 [Kosakonia sp. AG348]